MCDFVSELHNILKQSVGSDYAHNIIARNIYDFAYRVKENVEETSAWREEGYYNDDDIRLAIGRVILAYLDKDAE